MKTNKTLITLSMAAILPGCLVCSQASADILSFSWEGVFTVLDGNGAGFANTSIPSKGNNQYQTPISGTLVVDTVTGAGSATVVDFEFCSNVSGQPFDVSSLDLQTIGDGMGGPGTLVLGNMLYNWNGNTDVPVSMIWDAAGLMSEVANGLSPNQIITGVGATPASDGTYVGYNVPGTVTGPYGYPGYLGLGPTPMATTAWDTTSLCTRAGEANDGACMGLMPSGGLPLIFDAASNLNDETANTGGGIGGSPMIDGPFAGLNFTFDITSLTVAPVPVPGVFWLFGSGLALLVGVARREYGAAGV